MATFTVFCYGTGENHRKANNIISQFSKACDAENSIYIDGPSLLGTEVKANAQRATAQIINWLKGQEIDSHNINLAGFSRGSVTSVYIANNLKRLEKALAAKEQQLMSEGKKLDDGDKKFLTQLQHINLNLFLMDPVAGMSDKRKMDGRFIPDNVKNCVAVYQADEMRRDFKPQDLTRMIIASPQTTKISMLPMYGNHSDTTKIKSDKMTAGPQIAWHSLHQFLTQHGTRFKDDKKPEIVYRNDYKEPMALPQNPTSAELLQLFSKNHEERTAYLKSGLTTKLSDGIPTPRTQRTLNKHLRFYVKNADFFTNQLERELFKITYPKSFNYLFEKNQFDLRFPNDSHSPKADVEIELATLKQDNPELFARLKIRGVREVEHIISIGQPRGLHYLEPCATVQQVFPNLVTNELITQQASQMNKLSRLEMDVYRLTFRYQREKSSLSFSNDRAEHQRVKDIRNDINNLVNYGRTNNDIKYDLVLNKLEQHYKEMIRAASTSDLVPMLKKLLDSHGRQYTIQDPGAVRALLSTLVHTSMTLLREVIGFAGNLGYLGGGALFAIGHAIQDIGRRVNDMLGSLGYNPLKYVASAIAYTLEGVGFAIKNSFGLKPLTEFITSGLNGIRDALNSAILNTQVERFEVTTQQIPDVPERQALDPELPVDRDELKESLSMVQSEPQSESIDLHKTLNYRRFMQEHRPAVTSKDVRNDTELSNKDTNKMSLS